MTDKREMLEDMGLDKAEIDTLLPDEMKAQIQKSIQSLQKLYEEDIDTNTATIETALYYLPLFNIHGLILSSILGVNMDEYYLITEHLAAQLNLLKKE